MATVVGLYNGEDISLGDTVFNKISDNQCAWAITDLEGWWGLPDVDVADDPKAQSLDGSYYTFGRYLPRTISLRGQILPLDGVANKAVAARGTLNRALAPLARSRVLLSVEEDDPKVSLVQLAGTPLTRIDKTTGQMTFDIVLRAVDPVKYSSMLHTDSTTLASTAPGRTYNKTFYYSYGGKTTSGVISATNKGSYQSDATFTITGPVTRPRIEHVEQGVYLEFNVVLGIGETLTINTRTKKILFAGASRRNTLTPGSRWFSLSPGLNTIRYSGTQQIPAQEELIAGTNRITNPSMEATSGTVEVRRNIALNPGPRTADLTRWSFGAATGEVVTGSWVSTPGDGPEGRTGFARRTVTTAKTGGTGGPFYRAVSGDFSGVAGDVRTLSIWARFSHATEVVLNADVRLGTVGAGGTVSNPVQVAANVWTRLSMTVTALGPYDGSQLWVRTTATAPVIPVGGTYDIADVLIEDSSSLGQYFDGTFSPDSDLTPVWTGTAIASASVLTGMGVTSMPGNTARFFFSSTKWTASGLRALRVIPGGLYVSPGGDAGALRNGMVGGKTYTILATCRLDAPQTGTLDSLSRSISVYTQIGSAGYVRTSSAPAPNVAGTHQVRLTFSVPSGATEAFFRLFSGGVGGGGGDLWWDNVMLIEGNYNGKYFDGSFPYASWAGTPNASTSSRPYVPAVPETMLQLSYRDAWID